MQQLDAGVADGLSRMRHLPMQECYWDRPFLAFERRHDAALSIGIVSGWNPLRRRALGRCAARLVNAGHRVSCFSHSSGLTRPSVNYAGGAWLHEGGTWRPGQLLHGRTLTGQEARAHGELSRIDPRRRIEVLLSCRPEPGLVSREVQLPGLSMPIHVALSQVHGGLLSIDGVIAELRRALAGADWGSGHAAVNILLPQSGLDNARHPGTIAG